LKELGIFVNKNIEFIKSPTPLKPIINEQFKICAQSMITQKKSTVFYLDLFYTKFFLKIHSNKTYSYKSLIIILNKEVYSL